MLPRKRKKSKNSVASSLFQIKPANEKSKKDKKKIAFTKLRIVSRNLESCTLQLVPAQ